jgi:hypothetical protein
MDRTDASTSLAQASANGGLAACTLLKLTLGPRPADTERTKLKHFEKYALVEAVADPAAADGAEGLRCYPHSGFGAGTFYSRAKIDAKWTDGVPAAPIYEIEQAASSKKRSFDDLKSPEEVAAAAAGTAARRSAAAGGKVVKTTEKKIAERRTAGLFCCDAVSSTRHPCTYRTRFEAHLQRHKGFMTHEFRGQTSMDALLRLAVDPSADSNATSLRAGSRPNIKRGRATGGLAAGATPQAQATVTAATAAFECGRFNSHRRATYRKPQDLLDFLETLWQRDARTGKTIKPAAAQARRSPPPPPVHSTSLCDHCYFVC